MAGPGHGHKKSAAVPAAHPAAGAATIGIGVRCAGPCAAAAAMVYADFSRRLTRVLAIALLSVVCSDRARVCLTVSQPSPTTRRPSCRRSTPTDPSWPDSWSTPTSRISSYTWTKFSFSSRARVRACAHVHARGRAGRRRACTCTVTAARARVQFSVSFFSLCALTDHDHEFSLSPFPIFQFSRVSLITAPALGPRSASPPRRDRPSHAHRTVHCHADSNSESAGLLVAGHWS